MIYFYVLLLRIVAYLEGTDKIWAFAVVFSLIAFSTLKRIPIAGISKIPKPLFWIHSIVIVLLLHGFLLSELILRDFAVLMTYWIWFMFSWAYFQNRSLNQCLRYILIAFLVYNLANYIFFYLYFADQKLGINTILRLFGIHGYRIYFPLSSGANIYTFQISVNAILALYFVKNSRFKFTYLLVYGFYLFMLVLADSRLILLITLFFSLLYWVRFRDLYHLFKSYWYVIFLALVIFIIIFYNTDLFQGIKRPGELKDEFLSRLDIWRYASQVIFDDWKLITGHGINGLELNFPADIKAQFEDQNLQTSHNFYIQNIIDFGIVGLIFILFSIYSIMRIINRLKIRILTVIMVMFLLIGATESIPTIYTFDSTVFFVSLLALILQKNYGKDFEQPQTAYANT